MVRAASRGSIVSLVVLLPFIFWFAWRSKTHLRTIAVAVAALIAVPFVVEWALEAGTDLSHYLGSLDGVANGESAIGRYTVMTDAWNQFLENPVWGSSLVERNSLIYPHNFVVESFMATGIFGGLAFCYVVLHSVWKALRLLQRDAINGWMALLYLQALIGGMLSGALYYAPAFWALLGIVIASEVSANTPVEDACEFDSQTALTDEGSLTLQRPQGATVTQSLPLP